MKRVFLFIFCVCAIHAESNVVLRSQDNDSEACNTLGVQHDKKEKYIQALHLYKKGCKLKSSKACINLGQLYRYGYETQKNLNKAFEYFSQACKYGDGLGCNEAGVVAHELKDDENSSLYYMNGCYYNNATACYNMGYNFDMGLGVKRDDKIAVYGYDKACHLGSALACFATGQMYYIGNGVKKDEKIANEYWTNACLIGWEPACEAVKRQ